MKKMDIRTKFTKKTLKESLIKLMKTNPIRNIPIKAICADAEVSRSTFYTYYDDQYDLLEDIQNEIYENYKAGYSKLVKESGKREAENNFEKIFHDIAEKNDTVQVLLSENGDINFQKKIIEMRIMDMRKAMKRTKAMTINEKLERSCSIFFVHGSLALLQDWIKHGMDIPIPEMSKLVSKLWNDILG